MLDANLKAQLKAYLETVSYTHLDVYKRQQAVASDRGVLLSSRFHTTAFGRIYKEQA